MGKFWNLLSGWKTIIGYLAATLLGAYPMLIGAIEAALVDPSKKNLTELVIQAILGAGILDRVRKNLARLP